MSDDDQYQSASAEAAKSFPMQCSALRKNGHVLLKNRPCKIVEMSTSKTGKHGHAKVHLVGIDLFTGKKYDEVSPSTHNMDVPHVTRKEYMINDLNEDNYVTLMDNDGTQREDLKIDAQILAEVKKHLDHGDNGTATVLASMGEEKVVSTKWEAT